MPQFHLILTLIIFIATYIWLATEKTPRHLVVLCGSTALLLARILTFREAFALVNWNTLALLLGMFVLVETLSGVGIFERIALGLAQRLETRPMVLFFALCAAAGLLSMVVNNITVMIFMTSLTLQICQHVPLAPVPLITGEVCCANMLGAATLIGAPPNLMMAENLGIGFKRVAIHMGPLVTLSTLMFMTVYYFQNRSHYLASDRNPQALCMSRPPKSSFRGWKQLSLLLEVDFETLIFFMGLFVLVGALDHVGFFQMLAHRLAVVQNPVGLIWGTLWLSATMSALVDNIPMALAMAYLIKNLTAVSPGSPTGILVWATLIGLTLGGNMTPIGASPNVVAYSVLEKQKVRIGWIRWARLTVPGTLAALLTASLLVWAKFRLGWY